MRGTALKLTACLYALSAVQSTLATPQEYFAIHVVDEVSGRGVPLVEFQSMFRQRYYTDSDGYIAFLEPGLMDGKEVWFDIRSYGYESPKAPLDGKGMSLKPKAGGAIEIRLKRSQIAERLYRLTGYGIYRDSVLLGKRKPGPDTLLNALVTGQDTVQTALYRGKYLWLWQDTDRVGFFLGCFSMTGATAPLPSKIDPDKGIDFTYFVDKPGEFAKAMAKVDRTGSNPIWVDGLCVVQDKSGSEKLIGRYVAVDSKMKPLETGLLLWNDEKNLMQSLVKFDGNGEGVAAPYGRPFRVKDGDGEYLCFPPNDGCGLRVRANYESVIDAKAYEAFTCLDESGKVRRRPDGSVDWRWQAGAKQLKRADLDNLISDKLLTDGECPVAMRDLDTGKPVEVANGSIAWNPFLKRWLYVFHQKWGDSLLGEIWVASANSPDGPWRDARKVATHAMPDANYDCYNVIQHDELARGKYIYFSGTFVNTFSGTKSPTPYYNYNNLMYRVDLSDPRLALPEPPAGFTSVTPAE